MYSFSTQQIMLQIFSLSRLQSPSNEFCLVNYFEFYDLCSMLVLMSLNLQVYRTTLGKKFTPVGLFLFNLQLDLVFSSRVDLTKEQAIKSGSTVIGYFKRPVASLGARVTHWVTPITTSQGGGDTKTSGVCKLIRPNDSMCTYELAQDDLARPMV